MTLEEKKEREEIRTERENKIEVRDRGYVNDLIKGDYLYYHFRYSSYPTEIEEVYENEDEARKAGYKVRTGFGFEHDNYNVFCDSNLIMGSHNYAAFKTNEVKFINKTKFQLRNELKEFIDNFRYENNMIEGHLNPRYPYSILESDKTISFDELCNKFDCTERELGLVIDPDFEYEMNIECNVSSTLIIIYPIKKKKSEYIPKYSVTGCKASTKLIAPFILLSVFLMFFKQGILLVLMLWFIFFFYIVPKNNKEANKMRDINRKRNGGRK